MKTPVAVTRLRTTDREFVKVGSTLIYSDSCNYQKWVVTELFEGGFLAEDDYEERDFWFDKLQKGWELT
jgi:hypothetical protein